MRADYTQPPRQLYAPIEPYHRAMLDVGDGHSLYVEQSGNPNGIPAVFLHGGPGGGTGPVQRRFFDPKLYRIILFDQRGCGRSRPHASLTANTTWHLVGDMERIRESLGIDKWLVFGGSWGSTLALIYAQAHPERVSAMVLRGIFLMQQRELDWFYRGGTGTIFPESYDRFLSLLSETQRHDPIKAYYDVLTGDGNEDERLSFAREWSLWEGSTVTLTPDTSHQSQSLEAHFALAFARIEAHYFYHNGFLEYDDHILRGCPRIAHIPTTIVQGRYDAICPPKSAYMLHQNLKNSVLHMVPVAGHSAFEQGILHRLVEATDLFALNVK